MGGHPAGGAGTGGIGTIPLMESLKLGIGDYLKQLPGMQSQSQPMASPTSPQAVQFNSIKPGQGMSPTQRLAQIMRMGGA